MGLFSGVANAAGSAYDSVAGAADHVAGSTDEAVARQFDDSPGGGFVDEAVAIADPRRSASAQTEEDLAIYAMTTPAFSPLTAQHILTERPEGTGDIIDLPGPTVNEALPGANLPGPTPDETGGAVDYDAAAAGVADAAGTAADVSLDVAGDAGGWALGGLWDNIKGSPILLAAVALPVVYVVGQLFTFQVGGEPA